MLPMLMFFNLGYDFYANACLFLQIVLLYSKVPLTETFSMKFLLKQVKQELKRDNKHDQKTMNLGSLMSLKSSLFMISGSKKSFSVSESQLEPESETEPAVDSNIKEGSSLSFSESSSPALIGVEKSGFTFAEIHMS